MSEYPLCSCDEWWCGPGRHSPECHVVAKFKKLEQQLKDSEGRCKSRDKVIYSLEQQLAAAIKAMRDSDDLANAGFYDDATDVISTALKEQG